MFGKREHQFCRASEAGSEPRGQFGGGGEIHRRIAVDGQHGAAVGQAGRRGEARGHGDDGEPSRSGDADGLGECVGRVVAAESGCDVDDRCETAGELTGEGVGVDDRTGPGSPMARRTAAARSGGGEGRKAESRVMTEWRTPALESSKTMAESVTWRVMAAWAGSHSSRRPSTIILALTSSISECPPSGSSRCPG